MPAMRCHSWSLLLALCVALVTLFSPACVSAAGTLPGMYPRLLQLSGSNVILASTNDGRQGYIFRSEDRGVTFQQLSVIKPAVADPICCIALFEFPTQLGKYPAGTLLWSASVTLAVGPPRSMALELWRSSDAGVTWQALNPVVASTNGGLWEPHFHVAADGSLRCMFSDESHQPTYSQLLQQAVSHDGGETWSAPVSVVASTDPLARPGMATVVHVNASAADASAAYFMMTYEVCGHAPECAVHYRSSTDGANWGSPADMGTQLVATDGSYLAHTPVLVWAPRFGSPPGMLLVSAEMYFNRDGSVSPTGNGGTLFVAKADQLDSWQAVPAPLHYQNATAMGYCDNYSSPLLALDDEGLVLELASSFSGPGGACITAYNSSRIV